MTNPGYRAVHCINCTIPVQKFHDTAARVTVCLGTQQINTTQHCVLVAIRFLSVHDRCLRSESPSLCIPGNYYHHFFSSLHILISGAPRLEPFPSMTDNKSVNFQFPPFTTLSPVTPLAGEKRRYTWCVKRCTIVQPCKQKDLWWACLSQIFSDSLDFFPSPSSSFHNFSSFPPTRPGIRIF